MQQHTTPTTKTCTKCGETKPATPEFFSRAKKSRDGLQRYCKECNRAYYEANRQRIVERDHAYYVANRERIAAQKLVYNAANRERQIEYGRAWRAANPERQRERSRSYYVANRERIAAYVAANLDLASASARRRRARKLAAEGTHTAADVQAQYERQKGRCYYCHEKVGDAYHVDHVVPLTRGGSDGPENLVVACPTCNLSKHNKLPSEWPQGGRLL